MLVIIFILVIFLILLVGLLMWSKTAEKPIIKNKLSLKYDDSELKEIKAEFDHLLKEIK